MRRTRKGKAGLITIAPWPPPSELTDLISKTQHGISLEDQLTGVLDEVISGDPSGIDILI